jgi:hypothetical protein
LKFYNRIMEFQKQSINQNATVSLSLANNFFLQSSPSLLSDKLWTIKHTINDCSHSSLFTPPSTTSTIISQPHHCVSLNRWENRFNLLSISLRSSSTSISFNFQAEFVNKFLIELSLKRMKQLAPCLESFVTRVNDEVIARKYFLW